MGKRKIKGGDPGELNYSLGVLIILLMMFWFVCKCIGNSSSRSYYTEPMANKTDANLYYGNSPFAINGNNGLQYIRTTGGVINVPNSKTAMRHLYDEHAYKCGSLERSTTADDKQVKMHLDKRVDEGFRGPRSKTDSHELMCGSGHERDTLYY